MSDWWRERLAHWRQYILCVIVVQILLYQASDQVKPIGELVVESVLLFSIIFVGDSFGAWILKKRREMMVQDDVA